ncbi:MAG: hypothetical protein ACKPJJ_09020, partial [Planctomycetaceae bacterium]
RILLLLCLLVAGALGLRLAATDRLLPEFREPDAFETLEMQFQQDDADIVGGNGVERHDVIRPDFQSILDSGGLQHGRLIGNSGESSIGRFAVAEPEFIESVEFETSAACDRESQFGLQSIG